MTVREFDSIAVGTIDYDIFDSEKCLICTFSRDVTQSTETYRRNLVKRDKYADAKVTYVSTMNDIIRVVAVVEDRSRDDEVIFEA